MIIRPQSSVDESPTGRIEAELRRIGRSGERLAAAEGWTRAAARGLGAGLIAGASGLAAAGLSGRLVVRAEVDFGGLVLAALVLLMAARLHYLAGRLFGLGLEGAGRRIAAALASGSPAVARSIGKIVDARSATMGVAAGEIAAIGLLLALVVGAAALFGERGWIRLELGAQHAPHPLVCGLAVAAASCLVLFGRLARLDAESGLRKEVAGLLFGALDDAAFVADAPHPASAGAALDDRRHRASPYARLTFADLRRRLET